MPTEATAQSGEACVVILESDILVRHPLAEYLRDCGYRVIEAALSDEVLHLLDAAMFDVTVVLVDLQCSGSINGFGLARRIRERWKDVEVVLSRNPSHAAKEAGDLCEEGPALSKPYDHSIVADRIKRLIAARKRRAE